MKADWYLREWMAHAKKRQVDLIKDLGWTRRKASELYNGQQPYKREAVNEVSDWLNIEPYELLMTPEEALQLRHLRQAAIAIAAAQKPPLSSTQPAKTGRLRVAPMGN